jgi:hypothetical protein
MLMAATGAGVGAVAALRRFWRTNVVPDPEANDKRDADLEMGSFDSEQEGVSDTDPMLANPQEDTNNSDDKNTKKKPSGSGRMSLKELFKKYGLLAFLLHTVVYICTFLPIYFAFSHGINVGAFLKMVPFLGNVHLDPKGSTAVLAWCVTSATGLFRVPITIFGTPLVAKALDRIKASEKIRACSPRRSPCRLDTSSEVRPE